MSVTRRSTLSPILSFARTTGCAAVLAAFMAPSALIAQIQVQAFYPLLTDLLDATNNYGPVALTGSPPPAAPSGGVCVNGIYFYNTGGQNAQTPYLTTLDTTDFEIDVEFNIAAMPNSLAPVIMGGDSYRWLGIYLQANGTVGIKHNNSNLAWSSTTLTTGQWYGAYLRYERGTSQLWINNALVLQVAVGPLVTGNNLNVTTNDFSNGRAFNGCIRNLLIANDTRILATATTFGTGCAGSAGVPAMAPSNTPQLGGTFTINVTNLAPAAALSFMAVGFSNATSPLGPLPFNLQPFGLGAGCDLLVSPDVFVLFSVASGSGAFNLGLPSNPNLLGFALYFQCASLDPAATGGIAVGNAVDAQAGY